MPSAAITTEGATEKAGLEIAEVDRPGGKCRSKSYGTPNRDYFERILSYLNLVRYTRYGLCFRTLVDR